MRCLALAAVLGLAACGAPMTLATRFDTVGELGGPTPPRAAPRSPDQVRVFYATSPPGFKLRDNELTVEPGFAHTILGRAQVTWVEGGCNVAPLRNKSTVLARLRQAAYQQGGNAVIYAASALPDSGDGNEICSAMRTPLGTGWVVIVADPPAAATL